MQLTDKEKDEVLNLTFSLVQSAKGGISLFQLWADYRSTTGETFPLKELGFTSLKEYLKNNSEKFRFAVNDIDEELIHVKATENSVHILEMIKSQVDKKKRKPVFNPTRSSINRKSVHSGRLYRHPNASGSSYVPPPARLAARHSSIRRLRSSGVSSSSSSQLQSSKRCSVPVQLYKPPMSLHRVEKPKIELHKKAKVWNGELGMFINESDPIPQTPISTNNDDLESERFVSLHQVQERKKELHKNAKVWNEELGMFVNESDQMPQNSISTDYDDLESKLSVSLYQVQEPMKELHKDVKVWNEKLGMFVNDSDPKPQNSISKNKDDLESELSVSSHEVYEPKKELHKDVKVWNEELGMFLNESDPILQNPSPPNNFELKLPVISSVTSIYDESLRQVDHQATFPSPNYYSNAVRSDAMLPTVSLNNFQNISNFSIFSNAASAGTVPIPRFIPMDSHIASNLSNVSWKDMTAAVPAMHEFYPYGYDEKTQDEDDQNYNHHSVFDNSGITSPTYLPDNVDVRHELVDNSFKMHNFRNRQATEIPTIVVPKILNSRTLSNQRQMEKVWYETEKAHVIKPDVNLPPVRSVFSNEVKQSANLSSFGEIIEPSPVRKMYLANQLEFLKAVKQPSTSKSTSKVDEYKEWREHKRRQEELSANSYMNLNTSSSSATSLQGIPPHRYQNHQTLYRPNTMKSSPSTSSMNSFSSPATYQTQEPYENDSGHKVTNSRTSTIETIKDNSTDLILTTTAKAKSTAVRKMKSKKKLSESPEKSPKNSQYDPKDICVRPRRPSMLDGECVRELISKKETTKLVNVMKRRKSVWVEPAHNETEPVLEVAKEPEEPLPKLRKTPVKPKKSIAKKVLVKKPKTPKKKKTIAKSKAPSVIIPEILMTDSCDDEVLNLDAGKIDSRPTMMIPAKKNKLLSQFLEDIMKNQNQNIDDIEDLPSTSLSSKVNIPMAKIPPALQISQIKNQYVKDESESSIINLESPTKFTDSIQPELFNIPSTSKISLQKNSRASKFDLVKPSPASRKTQTSIKAMENDVDTKYPAIKDLKLKCRETKIPQPTYIVTKAPGGYKCTVKVNFKPHEAPGFYESELAAKQEAALMAIDYMNHPERAVQYPVDEDNGTNLAIRISLLFDGDLSKGYFDTTLAPLYSETYHRRLPDDWLAKVKTQSAFLRFEWLTGLNSKCIIYAASFL